MISEEYNEDDDDDAEDERRKATSAASNRLDNLLRFIRACSIVIRAHREGRTPMATSKITTELTPIGLARAEASYSTAAL